MRLVYCSSTKRRQMSVSIPTLVHGVLLVSREQYIGRGESIARFVCRIIRRHVKWRNLMWMGIIIYSSWHDSKEDAFSVCIMQLVYAPFSLFVNRWWGPLFYRDSESPRCPPYGSCLTLSTWLWRLIRILSVLILRRYINSYQLLQRECRTQNCFTCLGFFGVQNF